MLLLLLMVMLMLEHIFVKMTYGFWFCRGPYFSGSADVIATAWIYCGLVSFHINVNPVIVGPTNVAGMVSSATSTSSGTPVPVVPVVLVLSVLMGSVDGSDLVGHHAVVDVANLVAPALVVSVPDLVLTSTSTDIVVLTVFPHVQD